MHVFPFKTDAILVCNSFLAEADERKWPLAICVYAAI